MVRTAAEQHLCTKAWHALLLHRFEPVTDHELIRDHVPVNTPGASIGTASLTGCLAERSSHYLLQT